MGRRTAPGIVILLLCGALAAEEPAATPEDLVQRLGAPRYEDREAASRALEALGAAALPALDAARDDPDAEIARRAAELAHRIEVVGMLDVREVLSWLPEDTESLVVARGPFPAEAGRRAADGVPIEQFFQLQASGVVFDGRLWGRVSDALPEAPVQLAVEGSRRFRSRLGPPVEPYEGGHVLRYRDALGPSDPGPDAALAAAAERVESLGGHPVAVFESAAARRFRRLPQRLEPAWSQMLFVTWIRPDALAVATSRAYLAEMLARAGAAPGPEAARALPDDLREWSHVVATAPAWAVRHFADDPDDPTSPRNWPVAGKPYNRDPGAIGLVAWVAPDGLAVEVRYLSGHPGAIAAVRPFWTSRLPTAEVRQESADVVAIRLPADDARGVLFTWFTLATALGHPPVDSW